jgi:hypothetical protein
MRAHIARIASVLIMMATALSPASNADAIDETPSGGGAGGSIFVTLDRASLTTVPQATATIVVGNPLIADVRLVARGVMVVAGKGYGMTNLLGLDQYGRKLFERLVSVRGPVESVIVYRGSGRESYSCTTYCEPRVTLGDTPDFFNLVLGESGTRDGRIQQDARAQLGGGNFAPGGGAAPPVLGGVPPVSSGAAPAPGAYALPPAVFLPAPGRFR